MNKVVVGHGPHAVAFCEALGLDPKRVVSLDFHMKVGELVRIRVVSHVYDNEAKEFAQVLKEYNLVPKDGGGLVAQDITAMCHSAIHKAIRNNYV